MKLVGTVEPFINLQSIHLYDDNNHEIEYRVGELSNYASIVLSFLEDYSDITELNLHGAELYGLKIKDEIEGNLITKYNNKNRIEVKVI